VGAEPALASERGLADFERVASQIVAVELDQVKGVSRQRVAAVAEAIKDREPLLSRSYFLDVHEANINRLCSFGANVRQESHPMIFQGMACH
jgi:hypothetical protein